MAHRIKKIDYYNLIVQDQPGEAYKLLNELKELGINMAAFSAIPLSTNNTQLTVFPDDSYKLMKEIKLAGQNPDGPHKALLIQGDDELGALVDIHMKLAQANVNISAAHGVTDGGWGFGYVIYLRSDEFDKAVRALKL
jgi:hypothetical protein